MVVSETELYSKLNNFGYSNESIQMVKEYLQTRRVPNAIDTAGKIKRFLAKWDENWKFENGKLIYVPYDLEVVPEDHINDVLLDIYKDNSTGVGQGIEVFYKRIRNKYLNIRRIDVSKFLKSQKVYQITRPQLHKINHPILARSPNSRWGIDCISMISFSTANGGVRGWKYILTVVDYFSRYVWLRALKAQTAINVRSALENIVSETKTYPKIIQADNGSEFQGATSEWMKDNNIEYIKTLSYSPESNGLVEGKNKIVRKILRELMIRTNSRNWSDHLQTTALLMNTSVNGTTKQEPINLWKEGHELQAEQNEGVIALHEKRVTNSIKNNKTQEFKVGDHVRVKMGTLYSSVRKMIKSNNNKLIIVNYSPTIYKIKSILKKDVKDKTVGQEIISYEKLRYTLENLDGSEVSTQQKRNNPNRERRAKRFFASDFQLVTDPNEEGTFLENFTIRDALKLNKMDIPNEVAEERAPRPVRNPIPNPPNPPPIRNPIPIVPPVAAKGQPHEFWLEVLKEPFPNPVSAQNKAILSTVEDKVRLLKSKTKLIEYIDNIKRAHKGRVWNKFEMDKLRDIAIKSGYFYAEGKVQDVPIVPIPLPPIARRGPIVRAPVPEHIPRWARAQPVEQQPPQLPRAAPIAPQVDENLIGREVEKQNGPQKYIGKVISYNSAKQLYKIKYKDGVDSFIKQSTKNDVLQHLRNPIQAPILNRRNAVIGGIIHYY